MTPPRKLYKSISRPTGEAAALVCVGDLPTHNYSVSAYTLTEDVTRYMELNPDLPGVILLKEGNLFGMIPRDKIFERLGHRYGVELFLRKPIEELHENLDVGLHTIPSHIGIKEAVRYALERPMYEIYEPMVVTYENKDVRLLNVYTLLVAQTQMMDYLKNLAGNLNRIKTALSNNRNPSKTLEIIMKNLKQVVPYHQAAVFMKEPQEFKIASKEMTVYLPTHPIIKSTIYQSIIKMNQPIYLEDVDKVPSWKDIPQQGELRTWVGLPLKHGNRPLGVLSLARRTPSPFTKDEIDIAQIFADYIGTAFSIPPKPAPTN